METTMPNQWERRLSGRAKLVTLAFFGCFAWAQVSSSEHLPLDSVRELRLDRRQSVAVTAQGLFERDADTQRWRRRELPEGPEDLKSVSRDPRSSLLLVADAQGLWAVGPHTARRLGEGLPQPWRPIRLERSRAWPQRVYLSDASQGLFRSDDGGRSWRAIGAGLPEALGGGPGRYPTLRCSPHDPDVLLVGGSLGRLFRSADGGETWRPVGGWAAPRRIPAIIPVFHPHDPLRAWALVAQTERTSQIRHRRRRCDPPLPG